MTALVQMRLLCISTFNKMSNGKIVFITGATSGIGEATARLLAEKGYRLILCGRRKERLQKIKDELGDDIHILSFDVRERSQVFSSIDNLPGEWRNIDILVNNAGNAHGLAPIHEGDLEDWDAMIDINVKGFLYVAKAIIPGMVERKSGHIVNMGSIAGKEVYKLGNVYSASKHAVDALNNGMRMDLNEYGIKVSQVCPGLVETEFSVVRFKGDTDRAASVYKGYDPLKPEDIADLVYFVISRPTHVNISDTIVLATAQSSATVVKKNPK